MSRKTSRRQHSLPNADPLPPIIITRTPNDRLQISITEQSVTPEQVLDLSQTAILACFKRTRVHSDRLIYISTGFLFAAESPLPYGGTKTTPGFVQYKGTTTMDLLSYIVSSAFHRYWEYYDREALEFVVRAFNKALDLHFFGDKERLDEFLLRGMRRSGHADWNRTIVIPQRLMHVPESNNSFVVSQVLFTPSQLAPRKIHNYDGVVTLYSK
ncbi:hypothetical protein BDR26DRAFT_874153 [Obelidium mucronatum]|nr:hypothetical protein BDR26DRAFT_874153 [Obelidium mucronatum]